MNACHLAIDIGASSGRHIIGQVVDGKMQLTEVYRFENGLTRKNGHLCWDIDALAQSVVDGLAAAHEAGYAPQTIGIDTWAVDYVLLDQGDRRIGECVGYRDSRTDGVRDALELAGILSFDEHYARTGIQYQQFNTAYQLCALSREDRAALDAAHTMLMVPDYLGFVLTGAKAQEYTNASTTALVGAESCDWDDELIARLNLPRRIFQPIAMPGQALGHLRPEIAERVGFDAEVVLVASHDTGSAWLAVPARDSEAVYFSSGTWSLVGVENREPICTPASAAANLTNEGGYERRYRYLKNIMGLWMIQNVRRELGEATGTTPTWDELVAAAEQARAEGFRAVVDADDPEFLAPASMLAALRDVCDRSGQSVPATMGEYALCVYDSLAADYARTVAQLHELTGVDYTSINIVGGGSNNGYLNQATADACGLPVFAGPTEGTALGNLMVQFIYGGEYASLEEARAAIKQSFEIKQYLFHQAEGEKNMAMEDLGFIKGFTRMCNDGWLQGWHERNGGNLTYRMTDDEVAQARPYFDAVPRPWVKMGVCGPNLAGEHFVTTGSGKYMRNVAGAPDENIGIVEINEKGDSFRIVWGLLNGARPTSEFESHYMNHCVTAARTNGANRVIYHAHTPGIIEMSFIVPLEDRAFTRVLWQMMTECVVVFPGGVGVVPWMVPGGPAIAEASSELMKTYDTIVWAHHGLFAAGPDFDTTFGLAHTVEKAAELYVAARAANGGSDAFLNVISDQGLKDTCRDFNIQINEAFVD